jgi:penicillin-binding protein 2
MLIFDQFKKNDAPLRLLAAGILTGLLILLAGLWYVQIVSAGKYADKERGQSFRTIRIPAKRGGILDRNGVALAEDRATYNLSLYIDALRPLFTYEYTNTVRPDFQRTHGGARPKTGQVRELEKLSRYLVASNCVARLSGLLQIPLTLDEAAFQLHDERRPVLPLPVLEGATTAQLARFEEQPEHIRGLDVQTEMTRVYPFGVLAAHVLGQLTHDDSSVFDEDSFYNYRLDDYRGVIGLERAYDQELRGRAGLKRVRVNRLGYRHAEQIETPAEAGLNVVLTVDYRIQKAAEEGLRLHGTNTMGAVVVMDASNGDILAMASSPAYDPNMFSRRLTTRDMEYLGDPKLTPVINRATQGSYPPGSTFKIITALAALEAGVLNPEEVYDSPGLYPIGKGIHDTAAAGKYNFFLAFIKSSNCYFIEHGLKAGLPRLQEMMARFDLGQTNGLSALRQEVAGSVPTPDWIEAQKRQYQDWHWTIGDTANLCIGQELEVTPVQMALMTAAVANGGTIVWPRLVQRLEPQEKLPNADEATTFPNRVRGNIRVNPEHLELVRQAMLGDVAVPGATAYKAFHPHGPNALSDIQVAGKTGTAEVERAGHPANHIVWFASYAASENPPVVVLVMEESGAGGSGGGTCAPVALHVYEELERMKHLSQARSRVKGGTL